MTMISVSNTPTLRPPRRIRNPSVAPSSEKTRGASDQDIRKLVEKVSGELKGTGHQAKYLFCLGDIYDSYDKHQQAMALYRAGLEIDPVFARAWFRLGKDLELRALYKEALPHYQPDPRPPSGHTFYETSNRRAV